MPNPSAASPPSLLPWILDSLERPAGSWSAAQAGFIDGLLATPEGARILASLVVTTLRFRGSGLRPDQMGQVGTLLPVIEAFWNDPSAQTYRDLRIARW